MPGVGGIELGSPGVGLIGHGFGVVGFTLDRLIESFKLIGCLIGCLVIETMIV